ncbi:MAG: glycoside hydrolase N-terminal domain-containing protein, partial [Lachnospiraceae bacterium]
MKLKSGDSLCIDTPATRFGEAFPIGNGHMGAMIYGGVQQECLELSENTFFSGGNQDNHYQAQSAKAFQEMRAQIEQEDYRKAHETAESYIGVRHNYGTNLPVGKIMITSDNKENDITGYQRSLHLDKGIVSSEFFHTHQGESVKRMGWVSHPDKIMIYEMQTSKPMTFRIVYDNHNAEALADLDIEEEGIAFVTHGYETI